MQVAAIAIETLGMFEIEPPTFVKLHPASKAPDFCFLSLFWHDTFLVSSLVETPHFSCFSSLNNSPTNKAIKKIQLSKIVF